MTHLTKQRLGIALGLLVPLAIWAGDLVVPHTFTAGGPIRADEMNANFAAVRAHAARTFMSGSRLKVLGLKSADGVSVPVAIVGTPFWDAQLQTMCEPVWNQPPPWKCLPASPQSLVFLDAACTQPAVKAGRYNNQFQSFLTRPSAFATITGASGPEPRRLGMPTAVTRFYAGSACGPANCNGCCLANGSCDVGVNNTTCGSQGMVCNDCAALGNVCSNRMCIGGGTPVATGTCIEVIENTQLQTIGAVEPMTSFADVDFGEL